MMRTEFPKIRIPLGSGFPFKEILRSGDDGYVRLTALKEYLRLKRLRLGNDIDPNIILLSLTLSELNTTSIVTSAPASLTWMGAAPRCCLAL